MSSEYIHIFFCTDNNYAVPTYIALYSMRYNLIIGGARIKAHVLISDDFSELNKRLLESLSDESVSVDCIKTPDSFEDVAMHVVYITNASMYRLMIPGVVTQMKENSIDKCIYLDSDIVVEGDITELFDIDMGDYWIAGVPDRLSYTHYFNSKEGDEHRHKLNVPSLNGYINSGVLLINLKEIQSCGIANKLVEVGHNSDYPYGDQDIINSVCFGKIKTIPLKFNAMTPNLYFNDKAFIDCYGFQNIVDARENPIVLHYYTGTKPWSCKTNIKSGNWWKYVKMQDEEVLRSYIEPFLEKQNKSMYLLFKEAIRTITIKTGTYKVFRNAYHLFHKV